MEATKKKRLILKEGDVFTISIDEKTQGYGQIISIPNKYEFIMAVFEGRYLMNEEISLQEIVKSEILFLGYTTDALFYHKRWIIIGNLTSNLTSITLPFFKLSFPPDTKLVNYKLDFIRMATFEEDKLLSFLSNSAPISYQKALQAHYGLIEYVFEREFQYKHMVETLAKLNLLAD